MPGPLQLEHLTPLFGTDMLAQAFAERELLNDATPDQPTAAFSPIVQALRYIQTELEPLPEPAQLTTYGFVTSLCVCALAYTVAADGEREYTPVATSSGKPFRLSGWILGTSSGHIISVPDSVVGLCADILRQTSSYLDLVRDVPPSKGELPDRGFLLPIPGSQLYDPRPRMN